ncbi:MAG: protein translocase subunit SecF [Candidatus Portnoybacteria bacterium]|nr:protein translocase subunit SecF [Candidatus Portnoybacteria bacterium]
MLQIIHHRRIFYTISGILFCASILALVLWQLKLGIDFTGGSLLQIEFKNERPVNDFIKEKIAGLDLGEVSIQPLGEKGAILKFKDIDEETHQRILSELGGQDVLEEKSFESVGPVIGQELKKRAIYAIVIVLLMIVIYIAWAFRKVSKPVASWQYGLAAIGALLHDVVIPTGFFAVLGHFMGVEIGLLFVTALLTILGFSVHDTIVVFDRIRENLRKSVANTFEDVVEISINQTLVRSINTSLVVLLTLLAVFLFGGESVKYFSLVLIMGLFFGTYSSIFIASPLLVSWEKFRQKRASRRR